jgi:hypothetical protein
MLPSPGDVDFYDDHGWWVSPKLFADAEIDAALEGAQRYYAGDRDWELPATVNRYLNWTADQGGDRLSKDDYVVLQSAPLRAIGLAPLLGEVAARLARTDEVRHFGSALIQKPPMLDSDAARVGWHTDRAYWQTCTSESMLTAWIPLHDCDAEMGAITMIDRSHRWPSSPEADAVRAGTTFISNDVAAIERRFERLGLTITKVPVSLRKGQVSFHHCRTLHGSDINRSRSPRICLTVHFQDGENRYRAARKPDGEPVVHNPDRLVRRASNGSPDYRDPRVCPVVWAANRS